MKVAVQLHYKADRKEPFGALVRRIATVFEDAGLEPTVGAAFASDTAIDRALKKYTALAAFDRKVSLNPVVAPSRWLTNEGSGKPFPLESLFLLADGLPRSLPFTVARVTFKHEGFGYLEAPRLSFDQITGIVAIDSWGPSGRRRSLSALYVVEGVASAKNLPQLPAPVAAILSAFGKPRNRCQFLLPTAGGSVLTAPPPTPEKVQTDSAAALDEVRAIVGRCREGMPAMVAGLALPYDLPPIQEALGEAPATAGSRKPVLVETFKPRGYGCRFESGTYTLRRRTPNNHVVELSVDVGTWSHMVTAWYKVHGPEFRASVLLPVSARAAGQYPIGNAERWGQIVANLAVIVDELDRTFLSELEQAAGCAPEWFEPPC
jgi:hypothetical protein